MKQITCPHCGDTYPDFDAAHVCSKGPYAVKLKPKMNERIEKLAEQAGSTHKQNLGVYQFYTEELEKFAELMVREFAQLVEDNMDPYNAWITPGYVKEHFGVEE